MYWSLWFSGEAARCRMDWSFQPIGWSSHSLFTSTLRVQTPLIPALCLSLCVLSRPRRLRDPQRPLALVHAIQRQPLRLHPQRPLRAPARCARGGRCLRSRGPSPAWQPCLGAVPGGARGGECAASCWAPRGGASPASPATSPSLARSKSLW